MRKTSRSPIWQDAPAPPTARDMYAEGPMMMGRMPPPAKKKPAPKRKGRRAAKYPVRGRKGLMGGPGMNGVM